MWLLKLILYVIGRLTGHSLMVYHSAAYPLYPKSHLTLTVVFSLTTNTWEFKGYGAWMINKTFSFSEKDYGGILAQDMGAL